MQDAEATRLFLVMPPRFDAADMAPKLAEALGAGDIAAVLMTAEAGQTAALAETLVPLIQEAGAAALVADDTRLAGRMKADGVQVGGGLEDLRLAIESFRPKRIVGAGGITSRHAAMEAGEREPDYLFFGFPHGDTHDAAHPKTLALAEWWSALTELPAVAMAGRSPGSVADVAATGAAFVAVHDAVWAHPGGPREAVEVAQAALRQSGRHAA